LTGSVLVAEKVGHYACGAGEGSLVRIRLVGDVRRPPATVERCPACGDPHVRSALWRNPTEVDVGREPQVVVDGEGRQL
jgi:hypothetical protein